MHSSYAQIKAQFHTIVILRNLQEVLWFLDNSFSATWNSNENEIAEILKQWSGMWCSPSVNNSTIQTKEV